MTPCHNNCHSLTPTTTVHLCLKLHPYTQAPHLRTYPKISIFKIAILDPHFYQDAFLPKTSFLLWHAIFNGS